MAANSPAAPAAPRQGLSAALLTVIFLVVASLLFYGVYIALPGQQHFGALLAIGVLSLVFAGVCYLFQAASRNPEAQRALGWAFLAMGFATLFLSVGLGPTYNVESQGSQLFGLIILAIALGITVALITWRFRALESTHRQQVARATWRAEAPQSALSYSAAQSTTVPSTAPPPSAPAPPRGP